MEVNIIDWNMIIDVWKSGQIQLPKVIRWKKYLKEEDKEKSVYLGPEVGYARQQDCLQHSYSLTLLGRIFISKIKKYIDLDSKMLLTSLLVHDHGEGELGEDVLFINKVAKNDLDEYLVFRERYEELGKELWEEFNEAFLLQFALKNPEIFPDDARAIMSRLAEEKYYEALAFDAIEKWDYLLYAIEQANEHNNIKILVQVLRNSIPYFDELAVKLNGFGKEIWTPAIRDGFLITLEKYHGQFIEKKGEK